MASLQPDRWDSDQFKMAVRLETEAALMADRVLAITQGIKDELIARGIPDEKIDLVPNGVDPERFRPAPPDKELQQSLGLAGKVVIGFVGSLAAYEGLDNLLHAIALLSPEQRNRIACIFVGGGAARQQLEQMAQDLDLGSIAQFLGPVASNDVAAYYSLIDIAPFPRKGLPVCEIVSPLKPFEAMAMEKAVMCSDVAALAEIIQHECTGLLHRKDDPESLATSLARLIDQPELRARLGTAAREQVVRERDWKLIAKKATRVYAHLIRGMHDGIKTQMAGKGPH
jgi:glycosyltransferase involved in cell wall biosynthesis